MKPSFCAIANQQVGEDLAGTAGHYQTYVLIECPLPWAAKVFSANSIPPALRRYIKAVKAGRSVQFLAIHKGVVAASDSLTLMVYERAIPSNVTLSSTDSIASGSASNDFIKGYRGYGYRGYEFQLDNLTQVADCLHAHWQGDCIGQPITQTDILVCTHGMRDRCCARFGQPFFREAAQSVKQGNLPNTRVWKVSHIGGHRFAPTAISLPDGRYYGQLTLSVLQAIVTRSGCIRQLCSAYRGWGLLPAPLQSLEQQLMQNHGWEWFDCEVSYRILADSTKPDQGDPQETASAKRSRELSVEIAVEPNTSEQQKHLAPTHSLLYRAKIIQDPQKTVCVKASCSSTVTMPVIKYTVVDCVQVPCAQSTVAQSTREKDAVVETVSSP